MSNVVGESIDIDHFSISRRTFFLAILIFGFVCVLSFLCFDILPVASCERHFLGRIFRERSILEMFRLETFELKRLFQEPGTTLCLRGVLTRSEASEFATFGVASKIPGQFATSVRIYRLIPFKSVIDFVFIRTLSIDRIRSLRREVQTYRSIVDKATLKFPFSGSLFYFEHPEHWMFNILFHTFSQVIRCSGRNPLREDSSLHLNPCSSIWTLIPVLQTKPPLLSIPAHRWIQLHQRRADLQARVLLLSHPDLHTLLYVGHRLLGFLLARPERHTSACVARSHHTAYHGHSNFR